MIMTDTAGGLLAEYLSEDALAREFGIAVRTLQRWRRQRTGPPVTFIGRVPYYRVEGVRDWLLEREMKMARSKRAA
jgi:hypothetical protein